MTEEHQTLVPFAENKRSSEFGSALILKVLKRVNQLREAILPRENVSAMPHGHGWTFQQKREEGFLKETGGFQKKSSEIQIKHTQILTNDISSLDLFINELSTDMHEQLMSSLLQELDSVTKQCGRVVSIAKNESLADSILNGLANIEFSVDREVNVSGPTLMLNSETNEMLQRELMERGSEIEEKAREVTEETKNSALKREAERLTKFE